MNNSTLSDTELAALLDAFSEPAAVLSGDYMIIAANQAYRDHYAQFGQVAGLHCYQVSHGYQRPCDQEGESCPLQRCKQTGLRQRDLHLHNTNHGQEHVDVELLPIPVGEKDPHFFLEVMHLVKVANAKPEGEGLVGSSKAFNEMVSLIQRAAPSMITVLLLGESGTGKELVAKALHSASKRSQKPFVTVECSGLSENLFESEMFGHEKGAFTGAVNKKEGLVSAARGGTLFLDEVGDIPLSLQVKLLRLIETGTYRAVGGVELKHADFRLVCATHQNLADKVEAGLFRQDLYYRISSFPISLPPLRERVDDIPLLVEILLKRLVENEDIGSEAKELTISNEAMDLLQAYSYPGNIRELRNILERAMLLSDYQVISSEHLPKHIKPLLPNSALLDQTIIKPLPENSENGHKLVPLADLEAIYLTQIKKSTSLKNNELASQLGISERTLYRKLRGL